MTFSASYTQPVTRPSPQVEAQRLASALYNALFAAPPRRVATMTGPGRDRKYSDIKGHVLSVQDVRDHLAGRRTWATTLSTQDGMARCGIRDYDQGGEPVLLTALAAAAEQGITAFAIHMPTNGADHDGGHVYTLYAGLEPVKNIRGQLHSLSAGKGEIYPSQNPIRLPFGLHKRKNTRGRLLLQDGRCFDLDQPGQLVAGLRAVLALRPNSSPPEAKGDASTGGSGGSFSAYDATKWHGITEPHGRNLMTGPRCQTFFRVKMQLATLTSGNRVALERDGTLDDSDSAQVACLVYNLITSRRKGREAGDGAFPESEIRAIALAWRPKLRPGFSLEKYQAQVDYEIARYRPETYRPEATTRLGDGSQWAAVPLSEPTTRQRGRPVGSLGAQRVARLDTICTLLVEGTDVRRADIARATGKSTRQISDDLKALQAAGRIDIKRTRHGWHVLRVEGKRAKNQSGNYAGFDASQCEEICMGDTPPPPRSSGAAVAADETPSGDGFNVDPLVNIAAGQPVEDAIPESDPISQGGASAGGVCPIPVSSADQPTTAVEAVRLAFDTIPDLYQKLNTKTGELIRGKITLKRVRSFVADLAGTWRDRDIAKAISTVRWERSRFALERKAAESASASELKQRAKATAATWRQHEKKQNPRAAYSRIIAGIWADEERARADREERDQALLLSLADQALDDLRVPSLPVEVEPECVAALAAVAPQPRAEQINLFTLATEPRKVPSVAERIRLSRELGERNARLLEVAHAA